MAVAITQNNHFPLFACKPLPVPRLEHQGAGLGGGEGERPAEIFLKN